MSEKVSYFPQLIHFFTLEYNWNSPGIIEMKRTKNNLFFFNVWFYNSPSFQHYHRSSHSPLLPHIRMWLLENRVFTFWNSQGQKFWGDYSIHYMHENLRSKNWADLIPFPFSGCGVWGKMRRTPGFSLEAEK